MPPTTVIAKARPDITVESGQTVTIYGMAVIENAAVDATYLLMTTMMKSTGN